MYLFYSRSCSLVEKALLYLRFVFTVAACVRRMLDKIHSLLLLLLLLEIYLPARARKQSLSGRRSIECGVKEKIGIMRWGGRSLGRAIGDRVG